MVNELHQVEGVRDSKHLAKAFVILAYVFDAGHFCAEEDVDVGG